MLKITATHSIVIAASPEKVWDYTQDWRKRREWDDTVVKVEEIEDAPGEPKRIRARFQGGLRFDVHYKMNDRPRKTSLAMQASDGSSLMGHWLTGGGGSWRYDDRGDGRTEWFQFNTLTLKEHWLMRLLSPLLLWGLNRNTVRAMKKAKRLIEAAHK
jgi:hypothetical protein